MPNQASIIGSKSLRYKYYLQITAPSWSSTVRPKHAVMLIQEVTRFLPNRHLWAPCSAFPASPSSISSSHPLTSLAQPNPALHSRWPPTQATSTIPGQKAISLLGGGQHPMTGTALSSADVFHLLLSSPVSVKEDRHLHMSACSLTCSLPNLPSGRGLSFGFSGAHKSRYKTILCLSRDSTSQVSPPYLLSSLSERRRKEEAARKESWHTGILLQERGVVIR